MNRYPWSIWYGGTRRRIHVAARYSPIPGGEETDDSAPRAGVALAAGRPCVVVPTRRVRTGKEGVQVEAYNVDTMRHSRGGGNPRMNSVSFAIGYKTLETRNTQRPREGTHQGRMEKWAAVGAGEPHGIVARPWRRTRPLEWSRFHPSPRCRCTSRTCGTGSRGGRRSRRCCLPLLPCLVEPCCARRHEQCGHPGRPCRERN